MKIITKNGYIESERKRENDREKKVIEKWEYWEYYTALYVNAF